ncbi:MAG: sensor domain-containing diguanylate cyclase [Ilumatobacter sp.]|nr:sensor domain-containing diguanylate cyclase [Ilumatobacter sp.]
MRTERTPIAESARLGHLYALDLLDGPADERFDRITRVASRALRIPIALVSLVDADRQWFCSTQGIDAAETPRGDAFCSHAIAGQAPMMVVENALDDPRFAENPLVQGDPHIRFYAGAPIASPGGPLIGTLCIIDSEPRKLLRADAQVLRDLADLVEREVLFTGLALTDALTGLANRRAFTAAADRLVPLAARRYEPVSVLCFDVDGLKCVNDEYGHDVGDELLRRAARAISRSVRSSDLIARVGGDEFYAVLYGASENAASEVVAKIYDAVAADNARRPADPALSISIGSACAATGESTENVIRRADASMYRMKRELARRRTA